MFIGERKSVYANTFRSALLSVMKMLKLLLLSCAYAVIVKVVQDMKVGTVTEERHHSAQQLQSTLEHIILVTEQKLKNASTQLAKQHFDKVTTLHFDDPYPNEYCDMYVLKMDDGAFALSAILVFNFLLQLLSPLPDISVVKSLQLLGWSAACGDISLAQDASTIHQYFLKVAICLCTRDWKWLV